MAQSKVGCPLAEKIRETEEVLKRPKKILVRKAKSCLILACKRKLCVRLIAVHKQKSKKKEAKAPLLSCTIPVLDLQSCIIPILYPSFVPHSSCPSNLLSCISPILYASFPPVRSFSLMFCPTFAYSAYILSCILYTVQCTPFPAQPVSCLPSVLPPS